MPTKKVAKVRKKTKSKTVKRSSTARKTGTSSAGAKKTVKSSKAKSTGKKKAAKKSTKRPVGSKKKATKTAAPKAKRSVKSVPAGKPKKKASKAAPKGAGRVKVVGPRVTIRPQPALGSLAEEAESPRLIRYGGITVEIADEEKPLPKSKLTKRQLKEFARMLLEKRRELVGDVNHMTIDTFANSGNSSMPLHMADVGSDNWEQEFNIELLQAERTLVREIDAALQRIADRTYGICQATHKPIDTARLTAKPWAKYCIEYARLRELGRVP